ncbi:MAG TPA: 3-oxoacyl-ACP synthase, partial [Microvirga sp.]|nr:3-oxoacyl-ACP synthase [Microvirga sp.]
MKRIRSVVRGCGSYLPERVVTNHDLVAQVETSHEWIVQRTGIEQRYIAADHETTSYLGIRAAQAALKDAGLEAGDIDLVVVGTSTPD